MNLGLSIGIFAMKLSGIIQEQIEDQELKGEILIQMLGRRGSQKPTSLTSLTYSFNDDEHETSAGVSG